MRELRELAGFTVGVTADRRRDELASLLERRGARVVIAPALRIVPVPDDSQLREATRDCLARPPAIVVANDGMGMRGWLEAAEGWGLADPLRAVLDQAYVVARDQNAPDSDDTLTHLLDRGVAGQVIAVQLDGEQQPEFCASLRAAGAEVIEIPVYRWAAPLDPAPLHRLVDLISSRLVDAITFTSAPAVAALLAAAGGGVDVVLEALRSNVLAACVGPVTAAPLIRQGIPVIAPARARLSSMVRAIADELPQRATTIHVAGHELILRGHAAMVDGSLRPLAPAPMAVLRALASVPGKVRSRASLLPALPRGADEHAVEMAVARLRAGLGDPGFVQTVVKRGYRLPMD
jgi:uroporphyrinogen-III synthase